MNTKKIIMSAICSMFIAAGSVFAQTQVIAHRGYWDTFGSTQNSLVALNLANEIKVYGSEFDVLITPDGMPVVNHDDEIAGFRIEDTPYGLLKDLRLKNGEVLPTLEQYLIVGKANKATKLILEIKPHQKQENEDRAVAAAVALVKKYQLEEQVEYISFSLNVCQGILKLLPNAKIAYLRGELSPKELKDLGISGLDYHYSVFEKNPNWVKEAKALGLTTNVWTVNTPEVMKAMINLGVDYITTDKPLEVEALLKK